MIESLQPAVDGMPAMIAYWDRNLCNRFGNHAHTQWLGIDSLTMAGMHIRTVMGEERYALNLPYILGALQGKEQHFCRAIRSSDGKHAYQAMVQYVPDIVAGQVKGFYAMLSDITYMRRAEQLQRIAAIAFDTPQGMIITNAKKEILLVNRAFTEITGYTAQEAVGQTPHLLSSGRHDAAFFAAIWNRRKSGNVFLECLAISTVRDSDGTVSHYVGAISDNSFKQAAQDQVQSLAFSDSLTGLPNRRHLIVLLQQALIASTQHQRHCALLLINLDHFKNLNDSLGHEKGDLMLQQVGKRLTSCVRKGDSVARLMGNEFVVLLEGLCQTLRSAACDVELVAGKILEALGQPYRIGSADCHSTASIGITLCDRTTQGDCDEFLRRAELAMYAAKTEGRNTLRFFHPDMLAAVSARAALEAGLHTAIEKEQFVLYYQAQVTQTKQVVGAEALVRWQDPVRGLVLPGDFIALAEEIGLLTPIGNWVLESACRQLALWGGQPGLAHLTLAVNVSALQFHQDDFVPSVLAVLGRTGANPQRLKLELTESMLLVNVEGVIAKMKALKTSGIGFSLDDFGTGYSSLSALKRLPLDQLKIDKSFVRDILIDADDEAIARMVIALADSMGLAVIAEGVETQAQCDLLADLGCLNYQGYLFSRPLPVRAFEAFVALGGEADRRG